jgi:hypothetical protein
MLDISKQRDKHVFGYIGEHQALREEITVASRQTAMRAGLFDVLLMLEKQVVQEGGKPSCRSARDPVWGQVILATSLPTSPPQDFVGE